MPMTPPCARLARAAFSAFSRFWRLRRARSPRTPPTYQCQGFDEPMQRSPQQIARGRVLPLRAKLVLADGSFGDDDSS